MKQKKFGEFMILIAGETQAGVVYPKDVLEASIKKLDTSKAVNGYYIDAANKLPAFNFHNFKFDGKHLMGDLEILDTIEGKQFQKYIEEVDFYDSFDWEIFRIRGDAKVESGILTDLDITHVIA